MQKDEKRRTLEMSLADRCLKYEAIETEINYNNDDGGKNPLNMYEIVELRK